MNKRKSYKITIFGHYYTLYVDNNEEAELIEEMANYVNKRMYEVKVHNRTLDEKSVSILTAINIANELIALKKQNDKIPIMKEKLSSIIKYVDKTLENK